MTARLDIIGLLKVQLNGAVLLLDGQQVTFDVIDYTNLAYFVEKYLQVNKVGVLFTGKSASGLLQKKELLAMRIDDIVGVLDLYRIFVSESSKTKKPVLESHIGDLVQRCFTVVYGSNMPDIVTKS
jgi:hypothetical protein